ncbi:MAG TPA: dTDP-4-dehydrorhamnose 3,5-epimerase [Polyangia bacterium]
MQFRETALKGVLLLEPVIHRDPRGLLFESFRLDLAEKYRLPAFVQENESVSVRHTIRGLHYQLEKPQAKLVRVLSGSIYDVVVDIRRSSPTFGQWLGEFLTAENRLQLFVPAGFAHGFCVTSESAQVLYKCSDYYSGAADQRGIAWNDPNLAIKWPTDSPLVSEKDGALFSLQQQPVELLPP